MPSADRSKSMNGAGQILYWGVAEYIEFFSLNIAHHNWGLPFA